MSRIRAKVDLVMALRDIERLRQLPRARAKASQVVSAASLPHQADTAHRLERANEDEPIARAALHQHVEHPMDAVVEINVTSPRLVSLDKTPRARSAESVTGFVILDQIRLRLDDDSLTPAPKQRRADQRFGALEWIGLKEGPRQHGSN
jgi:hypothetical protein